MPCLERKTADASATYNGGVSLFGFGIEVEGGLFYSTDAKTSANSVGAYISLQHSAYIPAAAALLQSKPLSEFTFGDYGMLGGAFTNLFTFGGGFNFGVQSGSTPDGYQAGWETGGNLTLAPWSP